MLIWILLVLECSAKLRMNVDVAFYDLVRLVRYVNFHKYIYAQLIEVIYD